MTTALFGSATAPKQILIFAVITLSKGLIDIAELLSLVIRYLNRDCNLLLINCATLPYRVQYIMKENKKMK